MRRMLGLAVGWALAVAGMVALTPLSDGAAVAWRHWPHLRAAAPVPSRLYPGAVRTAAPAPASLPVAEGRIRHVIIISEDGLRPDALAETDTPRHQAVIAAGVRAAQATTIRRASTLPAHAAMLSGFDVRAHGLFWNSWKPERGMIQVPTVFDAVAHAAAFVGKWKLQHIAHPGTVEVFSRPGYLCPKVVAEAARYFTEHKPEVQFVHFSDPDEAGHAVGWMSADQMKALRRTDRCLGVLVDAVAAAHLDDETLFILSADHGGHGRTHSGALAEDRAIPWIAWGAGVRKGAVVARPVSTMDTAATVLWALGRPAPPGMQGRPVLEAFEAPEAD